jgi:hypothetical protein
MSGLGHNNGPTMESGGAWRRYTWTRARAELLPTLPIEVARRRVRRAGELGIDYRSYAGIRAATGRDIVALLFSSNALRLLRDDRIDPARAQRLTALRQADLLALVHPPHDPAHTAVRNPILLAAGKAPGLTETWGETRQRILALKGTIPADGVVVIGETHLERGWADTARLAGYIDADRYFT